MPEIKEIQTMTTPKGVYNSFPDLTVRAEVEELKKNGTGNGSGQNVNLTGLQTILNNVMTIIRSQVEDDAGTPQAYNIDISGLAAECDALIAGLTGSGSGGGDTPEKTLTSISATYSGGSVPVGTAVSALTGIVVTAHYSDGSTAVVTGYTLSGSIAEGSNTITVAYGGVTATITVVGVAEESGLEQYEYTIAGSGNLDANGGLFGGPYNYTDYIQIDPDYAAVTLAAYLAAPAESNTTVYSYIQWFNGDTFISRPDSMAYIEIGKVVAVHVNPVPDGATKFRISVQNNCERFELYKGEVSEEEVE